MEIFFKTPVFFYFLFSDVFKTIVSIQQVVTHAQSRPTKKTFEALIKTSKVEIIQCYPWQNLKNPVDNTISRYISL